MRKKRGDLSVSKHSSKQPRDNLALADAKQAIQNADHRARLVDEMFAAMDIDPRVIGPVFEESEASPEMKQQAEEELVTFISRHRRKPILDTEPGTRPRRRPTLMRGIMI